jgi:hypothetical protein
MVAMPAQRWVRRRIYSDQREQPTLVRVHPEHVSAKASSVIDRR